MAQAADTTPVKASDRTATQSDAPSPWRPLDDLRREIDHLFEDFDRRSWLQPFRAPGRSIRPLWNRDTLWNAPALDVVEKEQAFEVTVELPGMDEKQVEVTLRNGTLVVKGVKQEEKEEKKKDYYLRERQYGSFERSIALPNGVDAGKIEASFKSGVLKVLLPKTAEAQAAEKKIDVKSS